MENKELYFLSKVSDLFAGEINISELIDRLKEFL